MVKIILVSDSLLIREQVVQHAVGLAKRLNGGMVLLLLFASREEEIIEGERRGREVLTETAERIRREGILVECEVRPGHPVSEFLKFIAEVGSNHILVWGGEEVVGKKGGQAKGHWLNQVKGLIPGPWVIPGLRSGSDS